MLNVWAKAAAHNLKLHFLYLIFELSQEERQQVFNCVVLAQYGGKAHYDGGQSGLHMLVGV